METQNTSVTVAPSGDLAETVAKEMTAMDDEFELFVGDYIEFTGGRYFGTKGMIYYLDEELLRILPSGNSDRLTDINTDIFADEETKLRRDPTSLNTFVEIADLKEGNVVQTFTNDGETGPIYMIGTVNLEEDSVVLKQIDADGKELGDELTLEFQEDGRVRGIPRSVNFAVMRTQEAPKVEKEEEEETEETEEVKEEDEELLLEEEEEEAEEFVRQRKPEDVIYEDVDQKDDFIEAERAALKPEKRTDPKELQRIRRLMENCLQLRNDILEYKESGQVEMKPVVYETLSELLNGSNFPLAKQVLRVSKSLYLDHSPQYFDKDNPVADPTTIGDETIDIQYLEDVVQGGVAFLENEFKKGTGETDEISQLPQLYTVLKSFYDRYLRVITPLPSKSDSVESISYDRDFFRLNPLQTVTPKLKGLDHTDGGDKILRTDDIRNISMSYMRAIQPRLGKYLQRKTRVTGIVEEGDEAEVWLYILFPFLFLRDLGAIRSGKLSIDIGYSFSEPKTMEMILKEKGGIKMIPKAGDIIVVDKAGTTSGNIELEDWLKGQTLYGNGLGDILPSLKSVGLGNVELTPTQQEILLKKVSYYQANLKKFLIEIRKKANEIIQNPEPVQNFSFLSEDEQKKFLESLLEGEAILIDKVGEFELKYPSWQKNDLAIFAYLYTQYPDYVLASASGLPNVAQERKRVVDDMFLARLYEALAYEKKLKEEGEPPIINECDHVRNLADIRKIDNEDKRIQVIVRKLLPMFQGKTENHWIECKVCNQHLLCEHEHLMILEKTHPKQKDVIHKNLVLMFSGDGDFNGKYICRNCGQSIQDLEFDQGPEANDNGGELSGNEPSFEETETSLSKLLDKLLKIKSADSEAEAKLYSSSHNNNIVKLLHEIATNVGVYPPVDSYERMLEAAEREHKNRTFKRITDYNTSVEQQKKKMEKEGKKFAFPEYDQYLTQDLISNCIAAVLIEVQGAIPDYTIRSIAQGCGDATFEGYPLMTDEKQVGGLEYISCATSKLIRNEEPWNKTYWFTMPVSKDGLERRKNSIMTNVKPQITKMMNNADIQTFIEKKREDLRKEKGEKAISGRYIDIIPSDFLPDPIVLTQEQLKNAEAPVIGDAATPSQRAFAWLLEGYKLAKTKGIYEKGSPFSEASCCYSIVNSPMLFWKEQSMPALNRKLPPQGPRGSMLLLKMDLREPEHLLGEPKATLMYRLFLRVCFPREGIVNPRVGLQHEPGYDNKCPYCQFEFSVDPRLPPPQLYYSKDRKIQETYDKEYETEVQELYQEEINGLQKAGVVKGPVVEKETFETLLQATNRHFLLPSVPVKQVATDIQTLNGLATLNPEPFVGYTDILNNLITSIQALPQNPDESEIRLAYGPLSDKMTIFNNELLKPKLVERIGSDARGIILKEWDLLWNSPPQTLGEMLRTFFLVPLQRVINITHYEPINLLNPKRKSVYSIISPEDRKILMKFVTFHGNQVTQIKNALDKLDPNVRKLAIDQIKKCIEKLVVVIPVFIKILRANVLPFGSIGLPYIQRSILAGIFWEFINPSTLGGSFALRDIANSCFLKAQEKDENTIKSADEIRKIIISRNESEKNEIIDEFDKMTPEQKRAELAMKALGLGRWARGASKGIFAYDEEQQAFEAEERRKRGIQDFYGISGDQTEGDGGYDTYAADGDE